MSTYTENLTSPNRIAALILKYEKKLDERIHVIPSLKAPAAVFNAFPPKDLVRGPFDLILPPAERQKLLGTGDEDDDDKAASDPADGGDDGDPE